MSAIEIENLSKSYDSITAVSNLSLTVESGEIVALAGPDGAGKTSLFRSICGLIDFDEGSVRIAGYVLRSDFDRIKPILGYMPENFSLYPDLSVEENLKFFAGIFGVSRTDFETRKRSLYEFSGLGPFAKRRAQYLSGGMKQKLALCCNLVHQPRVLILDEPTKGVDPLSRRQFWDILRGLCDEGTAILVATPYMDELAYARRTVFMVGGKKLAEGTPEELVASYRGSVFQLPRPLERQQVESLRKSRQLMVQRIGASTRIRTPRSISPGDLTTMLTSIGIDCSGLKQVKPNLEDVFVELITHQEKLGSNGSSS